MNLALKGLIATLKNKYYSKVANESTKSINPLNANPEKWSNTLKQIVGNLPTICLSVFNHFMNLALKGLIATLKNKYYSKVAKKLLDPSNSPKTIGP